VDEGKRNAEVRRFMQAFTVPQAAAMQNRLVRLINRNKKRPV
jgi:hypothetical protein